MEEDSSKPLATESFSYSWLTHQKPSTSHNFLDILASISNEKFDFDVPVTPTSTLVDANEIFSDGLIRPVYVHTSTKVETTATTTSLPGSPASSINTLVNRNIDFIKKWRRILHKCFGFLKPQYRTLGSSRKNIRVVDLDRKVSEINQSSDYEPAMDFEEFAKMDEKIQGRKGLKRAESWSSTSALVSSPSQSWCDRESSIHEAILYCKRSIEK